MDEQPQPPPQTEPPRLLRSRSNRMIAGVAGGIAEHFNVDATLIRLAWVALILFGGGGIVLYVIAWVLMPEAAGDAVASPSGASSDTVRFVIGAVLIMLGLVALAGPISLAVIKFGIPLILIAVGIFVIVGKR